MQRILQLVAEHQVAIGLLGTLIVMLAVVAGVRRSGHKPD